MRNKLAILILLLLPFSLLGFQKIDNLIFDGNSIKSADTNGNIILDPDGTGKVRLNDLTATTVPYLDASKDLTSSSVTPTELGFLSGVTSALQTQLDGKLTGQVDETLEIRNRNYIGLYDSGNTNYIVLRAPTTLAGSWVMNLPTTVGSSGQVLTSDGAGNTSWDDAGGSGGSGSKSYITGASSDFESSNGDWDTDNGAGGAASYLTLSNSGVDELAGLKSLRVSKSANDATGEYVKLTTEAIDLEDRNKGQLFGSFSYDGTDANYAYGDFILELYDNTNSSVLYCGDSDDLEIPANQGTLNYNCHIESNTASIEVRLKANSTNATAYVLQFDSFKLGPAAQVETSVISGWQDFTPTGSWTTNTTYTGRYRRVGNLAEFKVKVEVAGSPTAASLSINLPITIDSSELYYGPDGISTLLSSGDANDDSSGASQFIVAGAYTGQNDRVYLYAPRSDTTYGQYLNVSNTAPIVWGTGDALNITFTVPIDGWSNGRVLTNNELGLQTIRVSGAGNGGTSITADTTDVDFTEISGSDTHSSWDGDSFTAPKAGYYKATGGIVVTVGSAWRIDAYIDGVLDKTAGYHGSSDTLVQLAWEGELEKDEVLSFRLNTSKTLSNNSTYHWIEISSVPDYTVLGAVEERKRVEDKILSADVTTDTTVTDLGASNLVPGMWYEVKGSLQWLNRQGDTFLKLAFTHDGNTVGYGVVGAPSGATGDHTKGNSLNFVFKATATTMTATTSSLSTGSALSGNGTKDESFIQIIERSDLVETTAF